MKWFFSLLALTALPAGAEQRTHLQVVELFTSQGCASCPPADALLAKLTDQEHLLPLAFHVDYWNYLGWEDDLSSPEATARQMAYRDQLGTAYVYTPQFVVAGSREFSLRDRAALVRHLATRPQASVRMRWEGPTLHLAPAPGGLTEGEIWQIRFQDQHIVDINRGENAGHRLAYHHGVLETQRLATWTNEALSLELTAPPGGTGLAILVVNMRGHIGAAAAWTQD